VRRDSVLVKFSMINLLQICFLSKLVYNIRVLLSLDMGIESMICAFCGSVSVRFWIEFQPEVV
jgi:hypothetical protein